MSLTLRNVVGRRLTHQEVDDNFTFLNTLASAGGSPTSTTVTNLSTVVGATVTEALNTLATSSGIANASGVAGTTITDALDQLDTDIQNVVAGAVPAEMTGRSIALTKNVTQTVGTTFGGSAPTQAYFLSNWDAVLDNVNTGFSNCNGVAIGMDSEHADDFYGGSTDSKTTFLPFSILNWCTAAGQRFCRSERMYAFGMGDAFINYKVNTYAAAPIQGDEGQGFGSVSGLYQQEYLVLPIISSIPTPATINTTTTQAIVKSKTAQSVAVASSAGISVGQWFVVEHHVPRSNPNMEAVKCTAVPDGTHVSGIFRAHHDSGVTIKPAFLMTVNTTGSLGQDRVLINLDAASYSTGTVTEITGGGYVGTGTTWANNMVGGNVLNIGAIALDADTYTGPPFDQAAPSVLGPLKSWYEIDQVFGVTSLGIYKTSTAGAHDYIGKGVGTTQTYTIRPCVRILKVVDRDTSDGLLVCTPTTSTWTVGDHLECIIPPYPDVTGYQYQLRGYTPGGLYRGMWMIRNAGARTFSFGLAFFDNLRIGGGADTVAFGTTIDMGSCSQNTGIGIGNCQTAAIVLSTIDQSGGTFSNNSGKISWAGGAYINFDSLVNHGVQIKGASESTNILDFYHSAFSPLTNIPLMSYSGAVRFLTNYATPAGGTVGLGIHLGSAGLTITYGSGVPNKAAPKGSWFMRSDGSTTNDRMYVNTDGSTAWAAVITAS